MSIYPKLRELIQPGCTIIEIGAHIGTDTAKLYKQLKPRRYVAIEPDQRNIKELIKLHLPISIVMFAVSNVTGTQDFWLSQGKIPHRDRIHTDSNSLLKPLKNTQRPAHVTFRKSTIKCYRLDDIINDKLIDLIWMDVQGAELLVIEGGQRTFEKTRYLYTEVQEGRYQGQPGLDGVMAALPGWEAIYKNGDNVLLENTAILDAPPTKG